MHEFPQYDQPDYQPTSWADIWESSNTNWAISDILPEGKQTHLIGTSGVGKSLLAFHLATAVVEGSPALTYYETEQQKVLWLDYENGPSTIKERLQSYGYTFDDIVWWKHKFHMSVFPDLPPLTSTEASDLLEHFINEAHIDVLIIDSMGLAMGGEENSADTFREFGRNMGQMLRRNNITTLILDNTGKDPGKGSRGSSRKKDEADVQWLLEETSIDTYQLTNLKDRIGGCPKTIGFTKHHDPILHWKRTAPKQVSHQASMIIKQLKSTGVQVTSQKHARELGVRGEQRYISEAVRWLKTQS